MWNTKGHQSQKEFLQSALETNRLSHAYIFTGPEHVGKKTIAIEFAHMVLGVDPANLQNLNPDLILCDGKDFPMEKARTLLSDLSFHPYFYPYKIAIIDNFEHVSPEVSNAILKTLEEPSSKTILILVSSTIKALLPTIVSRAQVVRFEKLPELEFLELVGADPKNLAIFNGKIGKFITYKEDAEYKETLDADIQRLLTLKRMAMPNRFAAIKEYAEIETEDLEVMFGSWLDYEQYDCMHGNPLLYKNLDIIIKSISGIRQNFNKKLILEKLFLQLQ